jgi:hypothetical protein
MNHEARYAESPLVDCDGEKCEPWSLERLLEWLGQFGQRRKHEDRGIEVLHAFLFVAKGDQVAIDCEMIQMRETFISTFGTERAWQLCRVLEAKHRARWASGFSLETYVELAFEAFVSMTFFVLHEDNVARCGNAGLKEMALRVAVSKDGNIYAAPALPRQRDDLCVGARVAHQ